MPRFFRDGICIPRVVSLRFLLLFLIFTLCLSAAINAQTNLFPLFSSGAYSGGSGDYSNTTNNQLLLQSSSGYIRVLHLSGDPNTSAVYNFQTGKDAYWGEQGDAGNYWFRGRNLIVQNGHVGIGTTNNQGYLLAVNGSAIFTSAWVKPYANWPDYVFDKGYSLPSLDSVSTFIQTYHHLPDIPSADSVRAKGVDLGSTQAAMLKTIEEMTLYLIEQKKEIEALKVENKQLKLQTERIDRLEQLIDQLSKKGSSSL